MKDLKTAGQATDLPEFPMQRACPYEPPEGYAALREQSPLTVVTLFDGRPAWVVTSHALARELFTDERLSSDWTNPRFPVTSPARGALQKHNVMVGMDRPEHGHYRKMVIPSFTVKRMNRLRPRLQAIVDERLDAMLAAGPPADFVESVAVPVPSIAICELLGVPYADHEYFESETRKLVIRTSGEIAASALANLRAYLDKLIAVKEAEPGEGLVDDLIADQLHQGRIDRETLVKLCTIMLTAGHETTANVISLGLLALLRHPEQFDALRDDPDLVPGAVEEMLRYLSIAEVVSRVATADFEVHGRRIRAGDAVFFTNSAVNRDPDAFPDPDVFDVRRAPRLHTGFGYGVHQCVGQNLARAELDIVFRAVATRLPRGLRLAVPFEEVKAKGPAGPQGIIDLPLTW
ncbi:pentalenic acid synthase [Sinosporangium album]|uniref:Pentalenic acid synthase n=1 Tax=Sinosporangium album TaxID=504805 RepID=A0A1G7YEG7_9ACTN|nr:cytochrome P450 [Sinosporangium album]SDG94773.1 pentalenic acid synthase [Sinosporangium album]